MSQTKDTINSLSQKLESASQETLRYAEQKGAGRAKISASCSIEKRLVVENKQFTLANTLETQKVAVGVHKDQKKGSASLNNYDAAALRSSVDDALALAKFSVADDLDQKLKAENLEACLQPPKNHSIFIVGQILWFLGGC
jgi:predicted Zn-dependent protease